MALLHVHLAGHAGVAGRHVGRRRDRSSGTTLDGHTSRSNAPPRCRSPASAGASAPASILPCPHRVRTPGAGRDQAAEVVADQLVGIAGRRDVVRVRSRPALRPCGCRRGSAPVRAPGSRAQTRRSRPPTRRRPDVPLERLSVVHRQGQRAEAYRAELRARAGLVDQQTCRRSRTPGYCAAPKLVPANGSRLSVMRGLETPASISMRAQTSTSMVPRVKSSASIVEGSTANVALADPPADTVVLMPADPR